MTAHSLCTIRFNFSWSTKLGKAVFVLFHTHAAFHGCKSSCRTSWIRYRLILLPGVNPAILIFWFPTSPSTPPFYYKLLPVSENKTVEKVGGNCKTRIS